MDCVLGEPVTRWEITSPVTELTAVIRYDCAGVPVGVMITAIDVPDADATV